MVKRTNRRLTTTLAADVLEEVILVYLAEGRTVPPASPMQDGDVAIKAPLATAAQVLGGSVHTHS